METFRPEGEERGGPRPVDADASGERRTTAILWTALVGGALIRLVLLLTAGGMEPRIVDEQHFVELAQSLYDGRGFAWADGQPTSIRPPLFPGLMAAVWTLAGGQSFVAVRVVLFLMSLGTVWLVYRLGASLFDRRTGAIAALGVAFYPSFLFSNLTLLTETPFTFLLVLTVWLCHLGLRDDSPAMLALAGLTCGLAALTRSVLWPFPVLGALVLVAASRGSWARRVTMAGAFCLCHAMVLTPWAVRNTQLQGVFTVVDTISGFNLWMANSEATPRDRIWDAVGQSGQEQFALKVRAAFPGRQLTEGEKDHWGRSAALEYVIGHPLVTAERSVRKFADFWGLDRELVAGIAQGLYAPPSSIAWALVAAILLAYPVTMLLAAGGIWMTSREISRTEWLVWTIAIFICAIHTLVFGHSRYRLPLMPFLLIYAAAAIRAQVWRSLPVSGWRTAAAAVTVAGLGLIWVQEVLVRDADRVRSFLSRITL